MATRQITVTLPEEIIEAGKAAVRNGQAKSFSAWLAARAAIQSDDELLAMIEEETALFEATATDADRAELARFLKEADVAFEESRRRKRKRDEGPA
jgi:hypothetical protein